MISFLGTVFILHLKAKISFSGRDQEDKLQLKYMAQMKLKFYKPINHLRKLNRTCDEEGGFLARSHFDVRSVFFVL